jgi:hypothetical protein
MPKNMVVIKMAIRNFEEEEDFLIKKSILA